MRARQSPCPQVAEHDAEEQAVGQGHEQGGVLLVVGGQAIHLQEGLEHPAQEAGFQLGGGLGVAHVIGGIGYAGQVGEPGERFLDFRHRRRRHPAGEVKGALAAAGVLAPARSTRCGSAGRSSWIECAPAPAGAAPQPPAPPGPPPPGRPPPWALSSAVALSTVPPGGSSRRMRTKCRELNRESTLWWASLVVK